jgi:hypothetical protein
MHFSIYLDDQTGQRLKKLARQFRTSRNAVIRQALQEWVARQGRRQWPPEFLQFQGEPEMPAFESYRSELVDQRGRDPLT